MTPVKRKLNTNSVDYHIGETTSTQANSQMWEEPVSLRKGSEQLHMIGDVRSNVPSMPFEVHNQQFEAMLGEYNGFPEQYQFVAPRKRLYSHYERISTESPVETKNRTDDYLIKYKTEICKNFEFKGKCQWGDTVS